MTQLLNIATNGLLSFQRGLDVTAHNIANANTPGYTRQVAEYAAVPGQPSDVGFIGNGVEISTIKRVYDQFLGSQLQASVSGQSRLAMMNSLAGKIDGLLANPETGLGPAMRSFFDAVQDVANDPSSLSARQALLGQADAFAQRLGSIDSRLRQIDAEINVRVRESVSEVNRLAASIAQFNNDIVLAERRTGNPPNDLLDQRDLLVRELAEIVDIDTVTQSDGSINVFIGTGQTLVLGSDSETLGTLQNEFDPTRLDVVYRSRIGDVPIGETALGGSLGGLLEFRAGMLDPTRQSIGETALALVVGVNTQHAAGMDLNGSLGGDLFNVPSPTVLPSTGNSGSLGATVGYLDVGAIDGTDFLLDYDGSGYTLTRSDTGQVVPMTGSGTGADPFVANGLSIVVSGAPAAGDRLLIRSAGDAAAGLGVAISDPRAIAAAGPTRSLVDSANLGDAGISEPEVADATDPNLLTTATIEFLSPTSYSVDGVGSFAYTSGDPIVIKGSRVTISGTPAAGDRFTIEANVGGVGDNRNALAIGATQTRKTLLGGTASINESYARLIADVGNSSSSLQSNLEAQTVLVDNVEASIASRSGVNLDEEAANLIRFQQAYQAMARVITVTGTLFDTLIGAVGR
ncbi:MAG: flagellar hook-associated protein FlgK [Woeseiaceae bacterium]|nr:flagellar hook-associated protein FlgK [Woeseiaceae bacterium]